MFQLYYQAIIRLCGIHMYVQHVYNVSRIQTVKGRAYARFYCVICIHVVRCVLVYYCTAL